MLAFRVLMLALFSVLLSDAAFAAPKCGNGIRNQGEQCDGAALGGATCTSLGFNGGTLGCTSTCTYDTTQCDPTATDLLVGQVAYDPTGTETLTEFVDLYNPTNSTISLTGWTLSDNTATWALPAGTTIGAHSWLSIARDAAGFEAHYGLVPDASGMPLALGNSGDTVVLRNGSVEVDRVAWEGFQTGWNITANDGQSIERTDPTIDTDSVGDWFVKATAAPRGGTFPIVCGDGLAEGTEECDGSDLSASTCNSLGFDTGTLACTATCTFDTSSCRDFVCGDNVSEGGEACDGTDLEGATCVSLGFDTGTLSCSPTCGYDTSACHDITCGDGLAEGGEACDGADLAGATCPSLGFDTGTLSCGPTCGYDTSSCRDYVCGDGLSEGTESCDGTDLEGATCTSLGFDAGTLSCNGTCGYDTSACIDYVCGNGVPEGTEACDGTNLQGATCISLGFDEGTLSCGPTCAYNTSACVDWVCGNNLVEGGEACDGTDLAGATCTSLGFDTGTLSCSGTCGYNTSACRDYVCGDGVSEGTEACDGADLEGATCVSLGFDAGTLSCSGTCAYNTSSCVDWVCGNNVAEGTEACDGTDLRGATCTSLGFTGGTLSCGGTCGYNTSACTSGPPVCGDNVVNGDHEECDGTADGACPGNCSDDCACPSVAGTGELELHMIDVGQGESVLVVSPDGFTLLFDAGVDAAGTAVNAYLSSIGIPALDYTVVSHMHADHLGGMDTVLTAHPEVVACFDHGQSYSSGEYTEYDVTAGTRRTEVSPGTFIDLGPSMTAEVVHAWQSSSNENDNSVVLKLTYGSLTYLLGGDCESTCESTYDPGHITVYQAHHHGSSGASSEAFLTKITPEAALIPVGLNNPYGHPAQATLDRFAAHAVDVWRTDLDGNIEVLATQATYSITSDGDCVPEVCNNSLDDDCDGLTDGADPDCAGGGLNHLLVWQVHYDTIGTDSVEESVDLYNPTSSPVNVGGWTLTDNAGTWTIPSGTTIQAHDYITIAANAAGFQALFGFAPDVAGMTLALGNTGDRMILKNSGGAEIDRCAWENYEPGWSIASPTGASIERTSTTVDTDTVNDWAVTNPAAPRGGL